MQFKLILSKGELYMRRDVVKGTDMTGLKTEDLLFMETVSVVMVGKKMAPGQKNGEESGSAVTRTPDLLTG